MDIVLDSNIIRSDLYFKSKEFEVLLDYLKKTDSHFVLPQIILDEIRGLFQRHLTDSIDQYKKSRDDLHRMLNFELYKESIPDLDAEVDKYIDFLINSLGVNEKYIIPYKNDYLPEVVSRAISRKKPFKDEDKGFRDSLIWLTLIDYCKSCDEKQIVFISNNPTDFGDQKDPASLHQELQEECDKVGINIIYFRSYKDFIEKHSIRINFVTEKWIEENLSGDWLKKVIENNLYNRFDKHVIMRYESRSERQATDHFKVIGFYPYQYTDIFIYEMLDESLLINVLVNAEIEIEFEFYDFDRDPYGSLYFSKTHSDYSIFDGSFYISIQYKENEIKDIELTDLDF